jgi:hypothetical protein
VLGPAGTDGAIGAGHVATGSLRLLRVGVGLLVSHFQRRDPGPSRCAVGIGIAELIVSFHPVLPKFQQAYAGAAATKLVAC